MTNVNCYKIYPSPVGELVLVGHDAGLAAVLWGKEDFHRVRLAAGQEHGLHPVLMEASVQLDEYFAGTRRVFTVPLDPVGTAFQREVWQALGTIPYGETRSYTRIAEQIGRPKAVRAVGAANGKNPISIILPCHRVIGVGGGLRGFAGGLDIKARLLALEGA